jgi:response regulator RpfG family c-di-GMP phosphodiesterase
LVADVIVSDLMMPDVDAAELMDALLTVEPSTGRFILYTGVPSANERAVSSMPGRFPCSISRCSSTN